MDTKLIRDRLDARAKQICCACARSRRPGTFNPSMHAHDIQTLPLTMNVNGMWQASPGTWAEIFDNPGGRVARTHYICVVDLINLLHNLGICEIKSLNSTAAVGAAKTATATSAPVAQENQNQSGACAGPSE